MIVEISSGAAGLFMGSFAPAAVLVRWIRTPHREAHKALAADSALMKRQMGTIYEYFIPKAIKDKEARDTPEN